MHKRLFNRSSSSSADNIQSTMVLLGTGYFAIINAVTAGMFYYDKQMALQKGWRVPEKTLHFCALLGGWPASWWAIEVTRG
jgi:uncharacterized membrane protein YsdA (DUF1294 family)